MKKQISSVLCPKISAFLLFSILMFARIPFSKSFDSNLVYERLEYEARFGFMNLGSMVLEVLDTVVCNGKKCYIISSRLNSNPDLSFIFSLNDSIEVVTTIDEFLPLRYEKRLHEGKYARYEKLMFIQDSLKVVLNDSLIIKTTEPTRDLLSFWYYLRQIPLIENDTFFMAIFETRQQHKIECVVGKREVIKTPLGRFNTIRVTPQAKGKGLFGTGGAMDIWYSDDHNRYPVLIKTKLKFGTVIFRLTGVSH